MYIGTILIDSDDFPYGFRYTPTHNNFFSLKAGDPRTMYENSSESFEIIPMCGIMKAGKRTSAQELRHQF